MATTKTAILDAVAALCRLDTPDFVERAVDTFLTQALQIYSRDRPYEDVQDVAGSAAKLQATPSDWEARFSVATKVVYPWQDEDSTVLEADDYSVDTVPVAGAPVEKIRFKSAEPAATETVRVWFTRAHTLTDDDCTVYSKDLAGFAHLVAAEIESAKASFYLGLREQGMATDLVDYGAKAAEARALSSMHLSKYRAALGLSEEGPTAAAVAGDIDTDPQYEPTVSHQRHHRARQR